MRSECANKLPLLYPNKEYGGSVRVGTLLYFMGVTGFDSNKGGTQKKVEGYK